MQVIDDLSYESFQMPPDTVVGAALGIFDGIHLGHQKIIRDTVAWARQHQGKALVYTFANHPAEVLANRRVPPRLMSIHRRLEIFESLGADITVIPAFTATLSQMTPDNFIQSVLNEKLSISMAVVGSNYLFGHDRRGDSALLRAMGEKYGFQVNVISPLEIDGEPISSTRIRNALTSGHIELANRMLGRPFEIDGSIIVGERRGRNMGIPTINLMLDDLSPLTDGVYATAVHLENRPLLMGIGYVGRKPTFHGSGQPRQLEVHLFDFNEDIYGMKARIEIHKRVRRSIKFSGAEELLTQIRKDIENVRQFFHASPHKK